MEDTTAVVNTLLKSTGVRGTAVPQHLKTPEDTVAMLARKLGIDEAKLSGMLTTNSAMVVVTNVTDNYEEQDTEDGSVRYI
jgi:CO/xanthine dehydrogenase Mo-binding subunit